MRSRYKSKMGQTLQIINIVPLLFFAVISMALCSHFFTQAMYAEVHTGLKHIAENSVMLLDTTYPGDYILVGDRALQLFKGEADITRDYSLIDKITEDTDTEITLFYQDTRILTTIRNAQGERIVGTGASLIVVNDVLKGETAHFYTSALVNNEPYFSYYMPLTNSDGRVVGMLFVGKPRHKADAAVRESLTSLFIATIIVMILISFVLSIYTNQIVKALLSIRAFLSEVSSGNLSAELDKSVSKRADEFGDIGRSALTMQRSLRTMIEQDALTELYNRRSADRKLRQIIQKHEDRGGSFALAIGDIDYFKGVNDTYGHDCGDIVLKKVADTLREHMRTHGFAARWGGEEFLLVFDHEDETTAYRELCTLSDKIRAMDTVYNGTTIKLTMTFGISAGNTNDIKELIRAADDKLYEGKNNGRDCVMR